MTVVDGSAPIAVAKQNIVISLTSSPTDPNGGLAKLFAHSVDNGSHDGDCGPVRIAVRRTDDESCNNLGVMVVTITIVHSLTLTTYLTVLSLIFMTEMILMKVNMLSSAVLT